MQLINADLGNNQYKCANCEFDYNIKVIIYSNKIEEFWKFKTKKYKKYIVYIHRGTSSIYEIKKAVNSSFIEDLKNSSFIGDLNCQLEPDTTDEDIDTYIAFQ
jgi:hypothetical protein